MTISTEYDHGILINHGGMPIPGAWFLTIQLDDLFLLGEFYVLLLFTVFSINRLLLLIDLVDGVLHLIGGR